MTAYLLVPSIALLYESFSKRVREYFMEYVVV